MISVIILKFVYGAIILTCIAGTIYMTYGAIKSKNIALIGIYALMWAVLIALGLKEIGL